MKNPKRYSFIKKFKYSFENYYSKGFKNQLILFCCCGLALTIILGIIIHLLFSDNTTGWSLWQTLMHLIDQGTITADDLDNKKYLLVMLFITLIGMVFTSTLIGIIGNAIGNIMDELNKGHSSVIEKDHIVILGFNDSVHIILDEIEEIHKSSGEDKTVVIVGNYSKDEMEHIAKEHGWIATRSRRHHHAKRATDPGTITRIYRSGELISENTFDMCAVEMASSIIINGEDDIENIKILIALTDYLKKNHVYIEDDGMPCIVCIIHEEASLEAARNVVKTSHKSDSDNIHYKAENKIRIIYYREIMFRMLRIACMQPGLAHIITCLMSHGINSFEIKKGLSEENDNFNQKITGKSIREIASHITGGIPIGYISSDKDTGFKIILNSTPDKYYNKNDSLIYLSNRSSLSFIDDSVIDPVATPCKKVSDKAVLLNKFNFLAIGKKSMSKKFITESRNNLNVQIDIHEIYDDPYNWDNLYNILESHSYWLDADDSRHLTNILIMDNEDIDNEQADNKIMLILLNLQNYLNQHHFIVNIIAEVNSPCNQALIESVNPNVFIISSQIINRFMVQIAENPLIFDVFSELLLQSKNTIVLRPFSLYVDITKPFNFQGIVNEVNNRSDRTELPEIPLGWIRIKHNGNQGTDSVLSPNRNQRSELFEDKGNCCFDDCKLVLISPKAAVYNTDERM